MNNIIDNTVDWADSKVSIDCSCGRVNQIFYGEGIIDYSEGVIKCQCGRVHMLIYNDNTLYKTTVPNDIQVKQLYTDAIFLCSCGKKHLLSESAVLPDISQCECGRIYKAIHFIVMMEAKDE